MRWLDCQRGQTSNKESSGNLFRQCTRCPGHYYYYSASYCYVCSHELCAENIPLIQTCDRIFLFCQCFKTIDLLSSVKFSGFNLLLKSFTPKDINGTFNKWVWNYMHSLVKYYSLRMFYFTHWCLLLAFV